MRNFVLSIVLIMVMPASIATAATVNLNGSGEAVGVSGLVVGSDTYDVAFSFSLSCIDVFSGCDNAGEDFTFSTSGGAATAVSALGDVLVAALNAGVYVGAGFQVTYLAPYETSGGFVDVSYVQVSHFGLPTNPAVATTSGTAFPLAQVLGGDVAYATFTTAVVPEPSVPVASPRGAALLAALLLTVAAWSIRWGRGQGSLG
jgi:hypothetical protein